MATIAAMYNKVKALDTDKIAADSIEETAENIATINAEQMHKGVNSLGYPIGRYRNPVYAELKNQQNPLPGYGVVDLRLTGAFYNRIETRVEGDKVVTYSDDEKADKLTEKYGDQIWGLSDQYKREYLNEFLRPAWGAKIKEATGLKLK